MVAVSVEPSSFLVSSTSNSVSLKWICAFSQLLDFSVRQYAPLPPRVIVTRMHRSQGYISLCDFYNRDSSRGFKIINLYNPSPVISTRLEIFLSHSLLFTPLPILAYSP